jgi:peptidoglycan/xylan/chitin deacetylase (PgdA/CDA1 family)/outer membrane lipoprotein-sorting protein
MPSQLIRRAAALAVFLLGISALAAPGWPQPPQPGGPDTALSWLRSGATAPRRVSYEGTKSITVWGGQVQASQVHVYHEAPDQTRLEYLAAGNQGGRVVIIKGRTMMEYVPARNQIIARPAPEADEERLAKGVLPQILTNYDISFAGMEQVAGREARVINVQSKFPGRPSLRIWEDRERRLILRFERYKPDGTLQETSAFINIRYDPVFPPELFTVPAPPGTQVQQQRPPSRMSIAEMAQRVGFTPQVPAHLPSGFQERGSRIVDIKGQPTATFVYSDGVSTITLFESRGPQGPPPRGRPVRIGSVQGTVAPRGPATLLHWNAGGISYTLVGELPQDDLVRVAASVPQVSGSRPLWPERGWASLTAPAPVAAEAAARPPAGRAPCALCWAAVPRSGPTPAWPGVPAVPISPYITNDTHPIGPGLAAEEVRIWRALETAGLSPFVVKVTVASDGVTQLSDGRPAHLAWIQFVYGMDWTGDAAAVVQEVQESARALAATTFRASSRIAQVVLTGQYQKSGAFDSRRRDVTFTARLGRDLFVSEPADLEAGLALSGAGDVWFSPALKAGELVMLPARVHEPRGVRSHRVAAPLPGDRSTETAERFRGNALQRIVETKRRLDGILFGIESDGRLWRGNPRRRQIALSFDDGPSPLATPLLLSVLRRFGVHATFFVIGEHAVPYPYLVKQMAAEGHEVESHTFHHPKLTTVDASTLREEIAAGAEVLTPLSGAPRWLRPPGGDYSVAVVDAARSAGMRLAMWTVNSGDWAFPPSNRLGERVLAGAEPGAIILLHDGTLNTVRALAGIIAELQRRGYDLVTLNDLARDTE